MSETPAPAAIAPARRDSGEVLKALRLPAAILVALLLFGAADHRVLSADNLRNVAVQASYLAIFALAQTVVILTRGFDLSLGLTVSLVSVVTAMTLAGGGGIPLGLLAGLGTGLGIGLVNGVLIGVIGVNALVTTLGVANIVLAFASTVSGGFPVTDLPPHFVALLSEGTLAGLPVPIGVAIVLVALVAATFKATRFGRSLFVIGANPRAAIAAGIRPAPALVGAYALCAGLAAIGGLLMTARTGSGEPNLGASLTLESIAAAVVGGVRLSGGEGGASAALFGALLVTVLSNGMNLVRIDGYLQQTVLGAIIIVCLLLARDTSRR